MSPQRSLILASAIFAMVWTAGMLAWMGPKDIAGVVILLITGAVTGGLYFAMRWWMDRLSAGRR